MNRPDCLGDEEHLWVGMGLGWVCRRCGKPGVDCEACDGTGWITPEGGDIADEDCPACRGTGVVPATGATGEVTDDG